MNFEERKQLKAMPDWERVRKYFPLLNEGKITKAQYDLIRQLPYTPTHKENNVVGASVREQKNGRVSQNTSAPGRKESNDAITQESFTTAMERADQLPLPRDTDGGIKEIAKLIAAG